MGKRTRAVPEKLRNGRELPKDFSEVREIVSGIPKYKIVIYSKDVWANCFRLVHLYYISLIADDPSKIQSLMKTRTRKPVTGIEDGRLINDMLTYSDYLFLREMAGFKSMLIQIIEENPKHYAMFRFYKLVQFSGRLNDLIVPGISHIS